ncbi:MAG TPA: hypothetical protein VJP59_03010 [Gemmatimonadota bacterium]|nr:hypothetical protein [Gemmatimonadota bacterium]
MMLERTEEESRAEAPRVRPLAPAAAVDVSVVILLERGRATAADLYRQYAPPLRDGGYSFEFLFVFGPGEEKMRGSFTEEAEPGEVRLLEVGQPVGQSAVLRLSGEHSNGRIVMSLPPAFRVAPEALVDLVRQIERGSDVAVARRRSQKGGWLHRLQSGFATWLLNSLTGSRLHDVTCRVLAIRRRVLSEIPLYGSYFRFIPVVAEREGFRVDEVAVRPHTEGGYKRVYSLATYFGWILDIFGIFFLLRFTYRPLRFFGSLGAIFAFAGSVILFVLFVQRMGGHGIANRPMLLLGVLLLTLGVQAVALGLIGEIVVHFQASRGTTYRLAREED